MPFKLPRWKSNIPVLETALNTLAQAIEDVFNGKQFTFGENIEWFTDGNNTYIDGQEGGTTTVAQLDPWNITVDGDGNVSVYPGSLNDLVPDNIFTPVALAAPTGINYVKCKATTDGKWPTSLEIAVETTKPKGIGTPSVGAAATAFEVCLGIVNNGKIFQIEHEPLTYMPETIQTSARTPAPGEEPFDRVWAWVRKTGNA